MTALDPGTPFPDLPLQDEKGSRAPGTHGETLWVFFKTTCPTTELTWPYLERLRTIAEGGTLRLVAVSQDDPAATQEFHRRLGVHTETLYDPPPWAASQALGLTSVPTFFLVAADGFIQDTAVGFQRDKMEGFAACAANLASRPVAPLFGVGESVPAIKPG